MRALDYSFVVIVDGYQSVHLVNTSDFDFYPAI